MFDFCVIGVTGVARCEQIYLGDAGGDYTLVGAAKRSEHESVIAICAT